MRIAHPTPRTLAGSDRSLFIALTGLRSPLSRLVGLRPLPHNPLLVFSVAFDSTVPDISTNAIANLAYAEERLFEPA